MTVSSAAARERFAAKLRNVRQRTGRTLRELQDVTFASDSALSRYLSGKSVPPWGIVLALCELAGTNPGELRADWRIARASRRSRAESHVAGEALHDLHAAAVSHLHQLNDEISSHIRTAHARGEPVPDRVLDLQRHGTAAAQELRAAQRLAQSLLRMPAQAMTADRKEVIDGGTK
jgi:transcriptional regulator with XRE-family HTH domain